MHERTKYLSNLAIYFLLTETLGTFVLPFLNRHMCNIKCIVCFSVRYWLSRRLLPRYTLSLRAMQLHNIPYAARFERSTIQGQKNIVSARTHFFLNNRYILLKISSRGMLFISPNTTFTLLDIIIIIIIIINNTVTISTGVDVIHNDLCSEFQIFLLGICNYRR